MNTCNRPYGYTVPLPTLGCQTRPPPFACYSAEIAVPKWTPPLLAPTTRPRTDYTISSPTRVTKDLQHRHEQRRRRREHHNARIRRTSTGTRVKPGDLVLVKEPDSALHNDCAQTKLTHDWWTGPWTVTAVMTPGLCYRVTHQGRRERVRRAATSHIKPYHRRPLTLRHEFGEEYAHFAWGPDLGLVADSTLASPLYTLVDRCTIQLPNGSWEWRNRGRYPNGFVSGFIAESKCLDSFTPMQLDVFHAL